MDLGQLAFEAGAREAARAMVFYFQDENGDSIAGQRIESSTSWCGWEWRNVGNEELDSFATSAVRDAINDRAKALAALAASGELISSVPTP